MRKAGRVTQQHDSPRRKLIRWQGFRYGGGASYFVTICTAHRRPLLGTVDLDGHVHETPAGKIVRETWQGISVRFPSVHLQAFVAMPDHLHAVLTIGGDPDAAEPQGNAILSRVVGAMKSISAIGINREQGVTGQHVWQARFHDRVIRDEDEFAHLCWYVEDNPNRWVSTRRSTDDVGRRT